MVAKELIPRKALSKAFMKIKPARFEMDQVRDNLAELLSRCNESEREEFHKNLIAYFLKKTYFDPSHFINTKGRNDLVIHNGSSAKSSVGVIIEVKSPANKTEMISTDKLNVKALHELVYYFMRERITHKNLEIKHLIVTNVYEWFIFDATSFETLFVQDHNFLKQFNDFEAGKLSGTRTDFFYKQIAEPFIDNSGSAIEFTRFNLKDYRNELERVDKSGSNSLIPLFKIFSPEHLLKIPSVNDSNVLNRGFYDELLHIIGLREVKEGNKKVIKRYKDGERNTGTLLEDTIIQLDSLDKLNRISNIDQYGNTSEEQLFGVALELAITWINRILFLKLLEAQLINYHRGDKSFEFLKPEKIETYDDLNSLFFQVLARRPADRNNDVRDDFINVPYLNSSLFETTEIEQSSIFISNLKDDKTIPVHQHTVLRNPNGKRVTGIIPALEYLFRFLNAYDFGSEGVSEIQEENKILINASVLGLIFEKINGYKDGSFFTPGFVTMFMSREIIRSAVVQKFNEASAALSSGKPFHSIEDIYEQIGKSGLFSPQDANEIVNSIKICDPAVGSGHFLVSALNEMIAVKNDLGILCDFEGRPLKNYWVEVANDELFIINKESGEEFFYQAPGTRTNKTIEHSFGGDIRSYKASQLPEAQVVQQSIFKEKRNIIENCLFGVDINPNSVKICRLRLWIELLKNAYYTPESNFTQLETLPNIDINIKKGNSLISRFAIDANLKQALKKGKWNIDSYRIAVSTYHNATDKKQKREMERLILEIKQNFSTEIRMNDPLKKRLDKLASELYYRFTGSFLFEDPVPYGKGGKNLDAQRKSEKEKLEKEIRQLNNKIDEIKANKIFENAFEWRFEFPEVLNDNGDFIGFDVVIGNPPYIRQEELGELKNYFQSIYQVFAPGGDIFSYFYELGHRLLRRNGHFAFINNTFDKTTAGRPLREFVANHFRLVKIIDMTDVVVFTEATTYPVIIMSRKDTPGGSFRFFRFTKSDFGNKKLLYDDSVYRGINQDELNPAVWNFTTKEKYQILSKIKNHQTVREKFGKCYRGIITGLNEAFITEKNLGEDTHLKYVYEGKDIKKWTTPKPVKKMIVFENKSSGSRFGSIPDDEVLAQMSKTYPQIFNHLAPFAVRASTRYDKGEFWWELRNCAYYDLFSKPKIIFPNLQNSNKFALDETGSYLNAPAVFLPSDDKVLLAVLNSKVVWYFLKSICVIRSGGYIEVKPQYFEQIPIPEIAKDARVELAGLTNSLIASCTANPQFDISELESGIDQVVYDIYHLTKEEIKTIEES